MLDLSDVTRTSRVRSLTARELSIAVEVYLIYGNATNCGVLVQAYSTENRNFTCTKFMEVIIDQGQNIRFGGVGATHQNGVSEN